MFLRNLFAAAMILTLFAFSHSGYANGPNIAVGIQSQEPAVTATASDSEPFSLTVAQVQQLKKNVLKDPTRPTGPGTPAQSFKVVPGGPQEFDACCTSCGKNGCSGCNSGPNGLNCGTGLIAADCQVVEDKVTCVKKDD